MATANNDQHANGNDLFHWFLSGATELYAHVKHLNLINVFPVADGDTGTNLAVTLRAMVESAKPVESFNRTLQAISQSALEGARGNSGTIFAAYISGLAIESDSYQSVTPEEFSGIASQAVKHLYSAVENPMEGTLMSVIRDWAQYLQHNKGRFQRFNELFHSAYHYAVGLLEKTKTQLDVLRKNNVVDAGAAGFVRFLEGINRVFSGNQSIETVAEEPFTAILTEEDTSAYRYCTEALVGLRAGLAADPDA
ncbi:MAG TPA: DAK2 domain-containing protein, partial [Candidatus Limiplasma sp.]|nr:DAK2 domain-containing protein [Candidatus Limiplasma sp.]